MGKVAIIGSGHGACSMAGYLGKRGHEVRLYDSKQFEDNLKPIKEAGGVNLTGSDTGFGAVSMVTTDINEAISGAPLILVIVPAFGHRPIAKDMAPYLKKGQRVVLAPGSVFGALEFLNILHASGLKEDVIVAETASNYFACRKKGPDVCDIKGIKNTMPVATIPADNINHVLEVLKGYLPTSIAWNNVIETSFGDANAIVHPITALLNAGRIENTKGNFDFYWEGISEGVARAMQVVDDERVAVAKAMGFDVKPHLVVTHDFYGHRERDTIFSFYSQSTVHGGEGPSAPSSLVHRYVTEDIPYGLVPMSEMGRLFGVPTPNIDGIIAILSTINEEDYRATGRSLSNLGLAGMSRDQIISVLLKGRSV